MNICRCLLPGLVAFVATVAPVAATAQTSEDVRVSTVGYPADTAKIASVVGQSTGTFSVFTEAGVEVFSGDLTDVGGVGQADFSDVVTPGVYYVEVPEVGQSVVFPISEDAAVLPFQAVMLGFYAWRSGVDIDFFFNGTRYSHKAGHLNDALIDFVDPDQAGTIVDATGGWYDAGDYGKYIVNSACTVGQMLRAYEDVGEKLENLSLPFIPESGGTIPDYLDEVKYNLDWMLKMQFDDGRVSHKLTPINFAGFVLPEDDDLDRYISPWGSAATAGFVASMAQASRIFRTYDVAYADRLLDAARLSYEYLVAHPENVRADLSDYDNQQYSTDDWDDRIWAAAEMWETTGDDSALQDFETRMANQPKDRNGNISMVDHDWDWGKLKNLGVFTYLASARGGRSESLVASIETEVLASANQIVETAFDGEEGFGRGYGTDYYWWGTNGLVPRGCIVLRRAYELTNDANYLDACMQQVANIFGRNQYNRSYVTGLGLNPPLNPHCRRSGASGHAYPGYVVGGGQSDADWLDLEESYETNEIAINWQGALAYALAQFIPEGATGEENADLFSDTDTDTDTDSDADTDGDSDGDTDTDTDADTDADTDSDTDADGDSDADADSGGDADSDSDGDSDTDPGNDSDSDDEESGSAAQDGCGCQLLGNARSQSTILSLLF